MKERLSKRLASKELLWFRCVEPREPAKNRGAARKTVAERAVLGRSIDCKANAP
jgi:hypothetical protein